MVNMLRHDHLSVAEVALAISDRIAVMRAGALEQVDKPDTIYRYSGTPFVAEFMGITNLLSGSIARREGSHVVLQAGATEFHMEGGTAQAGEAITFCLRPEALRVIATGESAPAGWATLAGTIARVELLGALTRMETRLADGALLRVALLDQPVEQLAAGSALTLAYDPRRVTAFKTA